MNSTRMKNRTKDIGLSVREYYEREVRSVDQQIELIRGVLWWYILPGFVGANLVYFGASPSLLASGAYFVATLLFCVGVWWWNQRAVDKDLLPVREEIGALLDGLNEIPSE